MKRLLRPREFLVRSDGRVRYIVLSTGHQLAAAGAAGLLVGWLAVASIGVLVHGSRLDDEGSEIRQAKIAYRDLLAEFGESDEDFTVFSDRFAAREPRLPGLPDLEVLVRPDGLAQGGAPGRTGIAEAGSIEERLRRSEAERARVLTGRQAIQAKLSRFGADLRALADRNQALHGTIQDLEQRLQAATERETSVAEERRRLEDRLAADPDEMGPGTDAGASLGREVASLKRQLSKKEGERTLESRIGGILAALSGMIGRRDDRQGARAELRDRVRGLEARLTALRDSQDEIVQGLAERTRSGVERVEKTVAMTGLDVDRLLERVPGKQQGVGGPYVPVDGPREPDLLLAGVASLDDAVERWEGLRRILRGLPLASPVDSFWVSSYFGRRKDPMTGKRAMHEGIDLSAAPKSQVLATAPGRVVFAGANGSYGRMVEIDHGLGIHTRYGHLRSITVKVGDELDYRDKIGLLGSSGRSTGPHVHYEILVDGKPHDPMKFLKAGRYVFKG